MKRLITFGFLFFIAFFVYGVTLEWCPSPDSWVVGYAIHYGTGNVTNWSPQIVSNSIPNDPCSPTTIISPGSNWLSNYTTRVDVGNKTECTLTNLIPGVTYYFVATAYTADGLESPPSNEVSYTVPNPPPNPPSNPTDFQLVGVK